MAVFSSTQNSAACCGGLRYRPMMSAALASNCGSLDAIERSNRWGRNLCLAHTRATVICDTAPSSPASLRLDQWVDPSAGFLLLVQAKILASIRSLTL